MHHMMTTPLTMKNLFHPASVKRRKKEQDCYLKNGSAVLEEILALCDGNCRIPICHFTATEIQRAIKHSEKKIELDEGYMVTGSLDNRLIFVRFCSQFYSVHRDIAVTAQTSHLKNVLRLVGCCLEFEEPVMVYEYVKGVALSDLLFGEVVFLHTEFTTPIIHRDIQPHKVIIDQNSSVAKIVDFSLSISLPPGELELQDQPIWGTFWYADPEYAALGIVTQKFDVYSFGVVLFQLLTGKKVSNSMYSNIEEGNAVDRDDHVIPVETIDFKEGVEPNTEEGNAMGRVNSAISEEAIYSETKGLNAVRYFIEKNNVMDIADPTLLEEHGISIQQ
ncbi:hypothetical protein CQW23_14662 [Capsicum baccatum]|uniref:Protein kinase domain-containing protein n=1 Tax=Capsicum baccatum TaxID=33114 RepID=A0A2G2WJT3_CAPBA|nr:hypothetical protein CQW23_14662 [Capsicum baccatum]